MAIDLGDEIFAAGQRSAIDDETTVDDGTFGSPDDMRVLRQLSQKAGVTLEKSRREAVGRHKRVHRVRGKLSETSEKDPRIADGCEEIPREQGLLTQLPYAVLAKERLVIQGEAVRGGIADELENATSRRLLAADRGLQHVPGKIDGRVLIRS